LDTAGHIRTDDAKQSESAAIPVSEYIQHGDMDINAWLAERILAQCFYPPQQSRLKSGQISILRLVVLLKQNRWLDGSQITFCRLPTGRLILVNGYHRLSAVVRWGGSASFNVQIKDVADNEQLDAVYALFDRTKNFRARTTEQGSTALHFNQHLGVSKTMANAVTKAMVLIRNNYRPINNNDRESLVEYDSLEDRLQLAMDWRAEAQALDTVLKPSRGSLKRKIVGGAVTAVALTTLKYQPVKAAIFWSAVAANDGLRKHMPEHTLVEWLMTYRIEAGSRDAFIATALAWNAFYHGRSLSVLRISSTSGVLKINGTPVKDSDVEEEAS
jgi:hypothetical protein